MTQDEIKNLSEKMVNKTITPSEKLAFLKELNAAIEGVTSDLNSLKEIKNISNNI